MELAFVAAMQHLPPRQRAVLILREVLGFSAKEVGDTLDASVPSVNSALQRAGIAEVEVFLRTKPLSGEWRWRHRPTVANGQLAVGTYTWMEQEKTHVPFSLDVLTMVGDRIHEVTAFVVRPADTEDGYSRWPDRAADPRRVEAVFRRFGLPDRVD